MSSIFPANRVAAVSTWLVSLGTLVVSIEGTFPHSWQNGAAAVAALLTKAAVTVKFLEGSQKSEALQSTAEDIAAASVPAATEE